MSSLHYIIIRQEEYKVYVRDAQILNLTGPWIHLLGFTHTIIWWPHTATDKKCTKRHKKKKITRCSQVISRSRRGAQRRSKPLGLSSGTVHSEVRSYIRRPLLQLKYIPLMTKMQTGLDQVFFKVWQKKTCMTHIVTTTPSRKKMGHTRLNVPD